MQKKQAVACFFVGVKRKREKHLFNNKIVIKLAVLKYRFMQQDFENEKKTLQKDLEFYLEFYKELSSRSEQMKRVVDLEIEKLVEKLKEIGK